MPESRHTKTSVLVESLYILADDIESEDGVPEACIIEAAQRIILLAKANKSTADTMACVMHEFEELKVITDRLFKSLTTKRGITDDDLEGLAGYQIWRKARDIEKATTTSCVEKSFSVDETTPGP